MQKITVFGAGYVGLVTGTCLAECGHEVLIIDVNAARIAQLSDGAVPFHEPGLRELVTRNVRAGRLTFRTSLPEREPDADFYFIAVGTPATENGSANLGYVYEVASTIGTRTRSGAIVVKSTVPVGTCERIAKAWPGRMVYSNPEFLKEGDAIRDFFKPDRIVIGCGELLAGNDVLTLLDLYDPLQVSTDKMQIMNWASAELTKYASNTMLAMRISFMNELAQLCAKTGASVHDVRLGVGSDSRIGNRFLFAGPGYGGSCFPKDVQALVAMGGEHDLPMHLAHAAHVVNERQIHYVYKLIEGALHGKLAGRRIALWGLAFKPETDDTRESPALKLAPLLQDKGAELVGNDPEAVGIIPFVTFDDPYATAEGADALVLLTEWRSFRTPDFARLKRSMRGDAIIDARNMWSPALVRGAGLRYFGVGVA